MVERVKIFEISEFEEDKRRGEYSCFPPLPLPDLLHSLLAQEFLRQRWLVLLDTCMR